MNKKSKYEQHGPEILELYEKGKNSSEIAKILGRKYRIKFSQSSIRSYKRFATQHEQEKTENVVHEDKQEQVIKFSAQSKEAIENLLYLSTEMDEIYSKQKTHALLQDKYLKNLETLEAKYEESIDKHVILNDTLHEIIIQNKEEKRNKISPYFIAGGCILTLTLAMVVGYYSRRYNSYVNFHYIIVISYILGGVIVGIGIGKLAKKIKAMWEEKLLKNRRVL